MYVDHCEINEGDNGEVRQSEVNQGDNFGELGQGSFTTLLQNVLNEMRHSGVNEGGNDNESQTESDSDESVAHSLDHVSDDEELIAVREKILRMKSKSQSISHNQTQTQSQLQTDDDHISIEQSDRNEGIGGNEEVGIGDTVQHEGIEDGGSDTDYPGSSEYDSPESSSKKMQCQNCKKYGHNKKTCKSQFVPSDKPNKLPLKRKAKQSEAGTSTTKQRNVRQKKDQVPNGYGVYIAPESGNTYVRAPGQRIPVNLNEAPLIQNSQTNSNVPSVRRQSTPKRPTRSATQSLMQKNGKDAASTKKSGT
ncbi:hypothetical protein LguiB_018442 [Lonicera macranthoides]